MSQDETRVSVMRCVVWSVRRTVLLIAWLHTFMATRGQQGTTRAPRPDSSQCQCRRGLVVLSRLGLLTYANQRPLLNFFLAFFLCRRTCHLQRQTSVGCAQPCRTSRPCPPQQPASGFWQACWPRATSRTRCVTAAAFTVHQLTAWNQSWIRCSGIGHA